MLEDDTAEILDPRGVWSLTNPLPDARSAHAAAVLPDGRVLIASGVEESKFEPTMKRRSGRYEPPHLSQALLASASLWDPRMGWRVTGHLREARGGGPAVALPGGRVLIVGGSQATYGPQYIDPRILTSGRPRVLASTESWSPITGQWTPASPMSQPRILHSATLLKDGRVLVVGGTPSDSTGEQSPVPAEMWDPRTNRWTPAASPRWVRKAHAAVRLPDGRVLITGGQLPVSPGRPEQEGILESVEMWDPQTNGWSEGRPLNVPRRGHAIAVLADGRVLVVGGTSATAHAEIWNPKTNRWNFTDALAEATGGDEHLVSLRDGRALLVGKNSVQFWTP